MDEETFLRLQYLRMINSDEFVVEQWRSSLDRFIADMWDRTPAKPVDRFLVPVEPDLGFSPGNVEWQFPKIRKKGKAKVKAAPIVGPRPFDPTREQRKQLAQEERIAQKEAKRQAIRDEFARWENGRLIRRG